jgi:hypothetical protein
MTTYSQRDSRWANITIGHSTSKISDFGCTIVCLANMANVTPDVVNAFLTAVDGFLVDRIIWKKINETKLGLTFPEGGRHYGYNDAEVYQAIQDYGSVLVEVDYDGVVATPSDRHWVLYIGNHQLIDPWTGTIKPTSSYPLVKGYAIIQKNNEQNNLSSSEENILRFLREQNADEGKVREAWGALTDKIALQGQVQTLQEKITDLESSQKDLQSQLDDLKLKLEEDKKSADDWQEMLSSANEQVETLTNKLEKANEERLDYKKRYYDALASFPSTANSPSIKEAFKYAFSLIIKKLKSYDRKS